MSLSQREFQRKYHHYRTNSKKEAKAEAGKVNEEGIDNDEAVAIKFGELGWALMLASAAKFAEESGIIPLQDKE